jgi:hypothetical protein
MTSTAYYGYLENLILDNLELSVRADRVLRAYGRINTLDDFMSLTKADVMALKGAGMRTWGEIKTLQKNLRDGQPEVNQMLAQDAPDLTALRDQAALAALQGFCAQADSSGTWSWMPSLAVAEAWRIADAFIAAREGKTDD